MSTSKHPLAVTEIRATRGFRALHPRELWNARELLWLFIWRDIKVRYSQTALGISWAVLQPLMMVLVLQLFLGRIRPLNTSGAPYPLFVLSGLLAWNFFANAVQQSAGSLLLHASLIKKVYFPRLLLPMATVMAAFVDFVCAWCVSLFIFAYYDCLPGVRLLVVPLLGLMTILCALSVGMWLSLIIMRFRDLRHTLSFMLQLWMFATPIAYSADLVPAQWRFLYAFNPMAGIVQGFRWAMLPGDMAFPLTDLALSGGITSLLLISGAYWFKRYESRFFDWL